MNTIKVVEVVGDGERLEIEMNLAIINLRKRFKIYSVQTHVNPITDPSTGMVQVLYTAIIQYGF